MPTLVLQPDETTGKDANLLSAAPTANQGSAQDGYLGDPVTNASRADRFVYQFDGVSAIPAGSSVTAVTLALYETYAGSTGLASWAGKLQRILVPWVESEVTWNSRSAGVPWTTPGCGSDGNDRAAAVSASVTLNGTDAPRFYSWSGSGLVADVQGWMNGAFGNHGWLLSAPDAEYQGVAETAYNRFVHSAYPYGARRPQLTIEYTEPPATCPVHLLRSHYVSQGVR